jgi:hypothetical protein
MRHLDRGGGERRARLRRHRARLPGRLNDRAGDEEARAIVQGMPAGTEAVLVTHLLDPERAADLAASIGARTVQVQGDMSAPDMRRLRVLALGARLFA